jgi:serine/threonine-protein kinase
MALEPGSRLGSYDVLALLGKGGMGEVYRARDEKLERDVAIKVLPEDVVRDRERLARFEREAKLLASLNHTNIASIYGLEDSDGKPFLVLELVEGEDLAERLKRGPIPLDDALEIARQVAEALEEAHEKGIVHRDLKPANVKLSPDGKVKVLDFGLAKAWSGEATEGSGASATQSQSPTLAHTGTQAGVILGTAAYMSPEQARGKPVAKRADIWAFGVLLFEMLTGQRLFSGEEVSDTLASILKEEPDWTRLPADTPRRLSDLLHRCLRKNARNRLHDIADARIEIEEMIEGGRDEVATGASTTPLSLLQRALPWAVAGALAIALGLVLWDSWQTPPTPFPLRLDTRLGPDLTLDMVALNRGPAAVLSPDGTLLAFIAREPGEASRIYVRPLNRLEARPLPGTEGARSPFFSPDGQWIGFFAGGRLQKIAVAGGAAVTLADAPQDRGGAWGEDGTIVLTPVSAQGVGLQRVSSSGGETRTLSNPDPEIDEVTHRWPQVLGEGRVLYTAHSILGSYEDASLVVEAFPDGPRKVVHRGGYHGRHLPSGHLVFIHQGTLFATPFDLEKVERTGPPVPVIKDVWASPLFAGAQFSFSDTGTLVYIAGEGGGDSPIHWLGRDGTTTPLRDEPANWYSPQFSPDGDRLAMNINDGTQWDIWIYEWSRSTLTRLTFDPAQESSPVWSPDGRHVVFASTRDGKGVSNLYWRPSDGSGEARRLTESGNRQRPGSWHPSGSFVVFREQSPETGWDVKILEMEWDEASGWTPATPTAFVDDPFDELHGAFSPDGRFLAYSSNESGRWEVYVRPFPGPGGKWQVSADGGTWPTWSKTRPELLYGTEGGEIMVASYTAAGDSFRSERPVPWSDVRYQELGITVSSFALHPDGERIALRLGEDAGGNAPDSVIVVTNFFDELRRLTSSPGE